MTSRGDDAPTATIGKGKKNVQTREVDGRPKSGKFIEQLNVQEFRERFRVLGGIPTRLLSGDPMSTE